MTENKKPELYPNQVFIFNGINFNTSDDTCYVNLIFANGDRGSFKVVEPIPVDGSRTVLEGATKKSLEEGIKRIINTKYTNKNIFLDDDIMDKIEETVEEMKLSKREKRKKIEELEKEEIKKIKEELKIKEFESFFTSRKIYQANGIFISGKGGLLQIPADSRYKQQNLHVITNDNPLIEFTFLNKDNKKVLTIKDIKNIDNSDIKIQTKVNYLTSIKSYKFLFEINGYLINKLSDKKNIKTNKFDIYNLISFYCDKKKDKEYAEFIYKEFSKPIKDITSKYKNSKEDFYLSKEDTENLKKIYRNFYEAVVIRKNINEVYKRNENIINKFNKIYKNLVPPIVDINISLYVHENKKKDFVNYIIKYWMDPVNSMFNIIKNKDKIDYFKCLDNLELTKILGILKLTKLFDDYGNDRLHDIYIYPKTENTKISTPRLMGYSIMDNSFVPNVEPLTTGKYSGFSIYKENIDKLREICKN